MIWGAHPYFWKHPHQQNCQKSWQKLLIFGGFWDKKKDVLCQWYDFPGWDLTMWSKTKLTRSFSVASNIPEKIREQFLVHSWSFNFWKTVGSDEGNWSESLNIFYLSSFTAVQQYAQQVRKYGNMCSILLTHVPNWDFVGRCILPCAVTLRLFNEQGWAAYQHINNIYVR